MKISEMYKEKKPIISLEIFPPKINSNEKVLYSVLEELTALKPDFISVTYSAGGSGGDNKTLEIASTIKNKFNVEAMVHLTCINSRHEDIQNHLKNFREHNIENILALRGDIQRGSSLDGHYLYAKDLIKDIKKWGPEFSIGAAAYPEGHIECEDFNESLRHLKEKIDEGVDFLTTQLFFDNDIFYNFFDKADKTGINIPISAGIMPILSKSQIDRMIYMCGVSLPSKIVRILTKYENDPKSLKKAGIEYSNSQIEDMIKHGFKNFHIYTMNEPSIATANFDCIGNSLKC